MEAFAREGTLMQSEGFYDMFVILDQIELIA
jgi:hypothetical protein